LLVFTSKRLMDPSPIIQTRNSVANNLRVNRRNEAVDIRVSTAREFRRFSYTFNAVIVLLLIFPCILRTFSPKMGEVWGNMGKEWCDVYPQRTCFYFLGFFTTVPVLVKIH